MNNQPIRCVNLDWLECHCFEPANQPRDADFFRAAGFVVHEREYGTRVYLQMFTLDDENGHAFMEVRRDPASKGITGIHLDTECHLRLTNYACYRDDAAQVMSQFIATYGYTFNRISRVDICLDFERFDYGDDPQAFLSRYLKRRYSKINQGNIHAHGSDTWNGQEWNSLSWGAPSSDIGTKFYNKTLELYDKSTNSYKKPYIRWAWKACGLVDDPIKVTRQVDGNSVTPMIWRIEFSIRSSVKRWYVIELNGKRKAYQSIRNTLDQYDSREKLLTMFASLANHYFHFKYWQEGVRKDRCPDKKLFRFDGQQFVYKVDKDSLVIGDGRNGIHPLTSLIAKLRAYSDTHTAVEIHRACDTLIEAMEAESIRSDMAHPWNWEELKALRVAISQRSRGNTHDVAVLLNEIRQFLHINDKTSIF